MKTIPFLLCAVLAAVPAFAAETPALRFVRSVELPGVQGRFDHFSLDVQGRRLFVAALGNNTLEVIDLASGKRAQSVAGLAKPTGVLYAAGSNRVWVANGADGTLRILDGRDFTAVTRVDSLDDADNLRFDAKANLAWLGYGDGALAVVDAGAKLVGSIKLAGHPESFQLEKTGGRLFVNVPDAQQVAVVDREKRTVAATWPMQTFRANFPMALDEKNARLFIGCRRPARLVVLDTATGRPVADLAVAGDTDDLFYDGQRKRLYLSCGEGFIDVIDQRDADTYAERERIPTVPGARTSFFDADRGEFYLAVPARGDRAAEIRVYEVVK